MKTRIFATLLVGASLLATTAVAQADPVKVGIAAEPYPPIAFKNAAGEWEGFALDYAKAVCKTAKLDCVITPMAWDGMMPALQAGKIDVIWGSMSITPERQKQIAFTIPIYNTPSVFIGNKDDKFDFGSGGLSGKSVGAQVSTIHAAYIEKAHPEATLKVYSQQDTANSDLAAGRIDLIIGDAVGMQGFLTSSDGACCEVKDFPKDPSFDTGIGGGMRKDDTKLKAAFDDAIRAIYKSGEFEPMAKKYFKFEVGTPPK
ncbi:transporter substrate-binding domain-containing protein [Labrys sedimenti]|uniref:transporter substrate-binding domain-containing protein n=1 Tax=Labrys sedimenti TaxID=3106036 RepID=UPI002ACAE057|nr:transporter substrate-binding domain-containing protein [Labrys sp. ZIDIC5]MDZ5453037.1 transporter substrate-binding domain-containing protein [Labrys sp. ZIDIC5]